MAHEDAAPGRLSLVPAVHSAAAELSADARVPAGVSAERRREVADQLAGLSDTDLAATTYRQVARMIAPPEESDQRRWGTRLLNAERAERAQRLRPLPPARHANGQGDLIAPAQPFIPGGVPVG